MMMAAAAAAAAATLVQPLEEGEWSAPPVTERTSDASGEMDVATALGFLRMCRHSDAQLFSGWRYGPGLYDLTPALDALVRTLASLLATFPLFLSHFIIIIIPSSILFIY